VTLASFLSRIERSPPHTNCCESPRETRAGVEIDIQCSGGRRKESWSVIVLVVVVHLQRHRVLRSKDSIARECFPLRCTSHHWETCWNRYRMRATSSLIESFPIDYPLQRQRISFRPAPIRAIIRRSRHPSRLLSFPMGIADRRPIEDTF